MKNKVVILPVREPWASMIASGEKKFEFREWVPKWVCGQEIWIVATGKAKTPREVIAKAFYGGTYFVDNNFCVSKSEKDLWGSYDEWSIANEKLQNQAYSGHYTYPSDSIINWGGIPDAFALKLNDIEKFKVPFTLSSIGIERTPMKYQYFEYNAPKGLIPSWTSVNAC